ncbi:hypothetical protein KAR91_07235 [Candidatus Pacearchaeota archaeon]|nr:hypothetical protein [Candidatus Pacearchaeota archaeon]
MKEDKMVDWKEDVRAEEDAIKLQEENMKDVLRGIRSEMWRSMFIIFIGAFIFVVAKTTFWDVCFISLCSIVAICNLLSSIVVVYINVDDVFDGEKGMTFPRYLTEKHLAFKKVHGEAKKYLEKKAMMNNVVIVASMVYIILSSLNIMCLMWK